MTKNGFTFIEVLVAMLILVIAVVSAVDIGRGAVRATKDSKEYSVANWLLQNTMVDLETRLETEGIDKGCEKKKEGKFNPPYDKYRYIHYCHEIDMRLSQTAAQTMRAQSEGKEDEANKEDAILKLILDTASDYMTKSIRELHTEVLWTDIKQQKKVSATTHFVKYDQPVSLPAIPSGGGK